MKPERGYYSLIQFCPDASRAESVNVGVVMFCPELEYLAARTSKGNKRAAKLVGRGNVQNAALNAAKEAIMRRLEVDRDSFQNLEDLEKFVRTRGNWLKLTDPRPMKVFNPEADLDNLFKELVGGTSRSESKAEKKVLFPTIQSAFEKLQSEGRAQLNPSVTIPVLEESLEVPYAYQNGILNLIKPQSFAGQASRSIDSAMKLAVKGDLVNRHSRESGPPAKLIIVSSFGDSPNPQIEQKVSALFNDYKVDNIPENRIAEFLVKVEKEAHSNDLVS